METSTSAPPPGTNSASMPVSGEMTIGDDDQIKIVRLFYGTNRKPTGSPVAPGYYGSERSARTNRIEYGVCHITLPPNHQFGKLEEYSLLRFETKNVPDKHVTVKTPKPIAKDQFFGELNRSVARSQNKEVFVFIHGFNVSWEESATRCGQIAYDLGIDSERGVAFLFSWPSQGRVFDYMADDTNARVTRHDFAEVLGQISTLSGATHINILAHSMGNQILSEALNQIGATLSTNAARPFNQVVMAAPDVDVDDLSDMSKNMLKTANHFTIYSCKTDLPLRFSRWVRGDNRRVGSFAVIPGFDTIDGTLLEIEGILHHNFADVPAILLDVKKLLRYGCGIKDRCCCCLKEVGNGNEKYWAFNGGIAAGCTHKNACP